MMNKTTQYRSEPDDLPSFSPKIPVRKTGGHFTNEAVIGRRRRQTRIYARHHREPGVRRDAGASRHEEDSVLDRFATMGIGGGRVVIGPSAAANNQEAVVTERQRILYRVHMIQRQERERRRAEGLARRRYGADDVNDAARGNIDNLPTVDMDMDEVIRKLENFHLSDGHEKERPEIVNVFSTPNLMLSENEESKIANPDILKENVESSNTVDAELDEIIEMLKKFHVGNARKSRSKLSSCF